MRFSTSNGLKCERFGRLVLTATALMLALIGSPRACGNTRAPRSRRRWTGCRLRTCSWDRLTRTSAPVTVTLASFYTEDAVLDVNGIESRGKKAIGEMYASMEQRSVLPRGTFHMLLTNPIIRIAGDTATADVVMDRDCFRRAQGAASFRRAGARA